MTYVDVVCLIKVNRLLNLRGKFYVFTFCIKYDIIQLEFKYRRKTTNENDYG